jgi:transcriptional regulator with XRE-family HTH domain
MAAATKRKPVRKQVPVAHRPTFMRAWRDAGGVTLEAMAERLGYDDHTTLSKMERGLVPYSQGILEGYARELGCSVIDLLARAPGEAEDILGLWSRLDETGRKMLLGAAKAALE